MSGWGDSGCDLQIWRFDERTGMEFGKFLTSAKKWNCMGGLQRRDEPVTAIWSQK